MQDSNFNEPFIPFLKTQLVDLNWITNVDKSSWENISFGNIVKQAGINVKPSEANVERFVAGEHIYPDDLTIRIWGLVNDTQLGPAFHVKFVKGQILYPTRRTYLRKMAVATFDGICANTTFILEGKSKKVLPTFLPFLMQSEGFTRYSIDNSKGSTNPYINFKDLAKFEFKLPPLAFQKPFADLLWSIESQIEQTVAFAQSLKNLKKGLLAGLFQPNGSFGTLAPVGSCAAVRFDAIAFHVSRTERNPLANGITRYVGLEHIRSEMLQITEYGDIATDNVTFTKRFKKGQLLFGRRRAYLKKAGIADFDGICSGDILVFEPNPKKVDKELFKYIVQNDAFFEYAVSTSAGSLSPRTNWEDLKNYELALPTNLETQSAIAQVLNELEKRQHELSALRTSLHDIKKQLIHQILR
jgi:type I restriction enzyme, S subunit